MALRLSIAALTVAALLWSGGSSGVRAGKPPELPIKQLIICQSSAPQESTGCVLLGLGIHADAALNGMIMLGAPEEGGPVEQLPVLPFALGAAEGRSTEFTCPYLKHLAAQCPTSEIVLGDVAHGVLDNLHILEEAGKLCLQAEDYQHDGRWERACQCYEAVHQLVPGSRYDRLALNRLSEIYAEMAREADAAVGEEQEILPLPLLPLPAQTAPPGQKDKKPDASPQEDAPASPDGETVRGGAVPLVDPKGVHLLEVLQELLHTPPVRRCTCHAGADEATGTTAPPEDPNMTNLTRNWFEALQGGACLDLDTSSPTGVRVRCQLQLGGIACRVVAEPSSPSWVIVYLLYP
jgi:hypothetical protein